MRIWDKEYANIGFIQHGHNIYVHDLLELGDGRLLSICGHTLNIPQVGVKVWGIGGERMEYWDSLRARR